MTETIHVDDIAYWHEVILAHLLQGECSKIDPKFTADLAVTRMSDLRVARIQSVPHRYERTEKHLRNSHQNDLVLIAQLTGSSVQTQDGRELLLNPGEIMCFDSTRPLTLSLQTEFDQLVLHIPREIVLESLGPTERFTTVELTKRTPVGGLLVSFLKSIDQVLNQVSSSTASQLSQTAISLVMTALAEQSSMKLDHPNWARNALLYRAEQFILNHSRIQTLTSQMVAESLGISLRYLQHIFQDMRRTPSECIWECRLRNSEQDLNNPCLGALTISDIASRSGFSDFAHFSRRFKAAYGISPTEYRNRAQEKLMRTTDLASYRPNLDDTRLQ